MIGLGALAIMVLPRAWSMSMLGASRPLGASMCALLTIFFLWWLTPDAPIRLIPYQNATMLKWAGALTCMVLGGIIWDSKRDGESRKPIFDGIDWALAGAFFALAVVLRLMFPSGAAVDEGIHFQEMQDRLRNVELPPLWGFAGSGGYPHLLHRLILNLSEFLRPVVDPFLLEKILASSMGAVSVGALFLAARVLGERHVAIAAGLILSMMGWHWINSRFIYVYPHDLANISLGTLCALLAFERRSATAAILVGVIIAYTSVLQKIGLMTGPFVLVVFADYFLFSGRASRTRTVRVAGLILVAGLLAYWPVFAGTRDEQMNPNVALAMSERGVGFAGSIMREFSKVCVMTLDAFYQLQIQMHDIPRHIWRGGKPILDPVCSVLFSIGLIGASLRLFRSRECRLQLAGLLVFILPMALSFPINSEGPHGLSRRMVGASFFVAWLSAGGAAIVASRLMSARHLARLTISLGALVLITNLFELYAGHRALTKTLWYSDQGGARAAMIAVTREFASNGYHVIVLNEHNTTINGANTDLPNLRIALNLEELRQMALAQRGTWLVVVIPSGSGTEYGAGTVQALADIVPTSEWIFGPPDLQGVPMLRYAIVRPAA